MAPSISPVPGDVKKKCMYERAAASARLVAGRGFAAPFLVGAGALF
jgi:hypothetical protein